MHGWRKRSCAPSSNRPASTAGAAACGPMPSSSAARHTSSGSPTGSAAASCRNRCVSAGSVSSRRRNALLDGGSCDRPGAAEAARELLGAHAAREFEQRERVAVRLRDDPLADALVEPARDRRRKQRARVFVAEPGEPQLRQAGSRGAPRWARGRRTRSPRARPAAAARRTRAPAPRRRRATGGRRPRTAAAAPRRPRPAA